MVKINRYKEKSGRVLELASECEDSLGCREQPGCVDRESNGVGEAGAWVRWSFVKRASTVLRKKKKKGPTSGKAKCKVQ